MRKVSALFFDLDGTLTDSSEGITRTIAHVVEKMGHQAPPLDQLTRFVGPPLIESLGHFVGRDRADEALRHYLQRYVIEGRGLIENGLYDGIADVLPKLAAKKRLYVVTAKEEKISIKIVAHFGLTPHFQAVFGSRDDGSHADKTSLIAYVCKTEKIAPEDAVMIGDTKFDMIGAAQNKMKSVGAAWGYGSRADLEAHGATAIAEKPEDLLNLLLSA
jgi:phosphoglycolate phosphatase